MCLQLNQKRERAKKKLDKFREQLENIHAEESTAEEEEGSTEVMNVYLEVCQAVFWKN